MSDVNKGEFKFSILARGQSGEETIFRCKDSESMTNWTVTILSAKDALSDVKRRQNRVRRQPIPQPNATPQPPQHSKERMSIKELRAIAHAEGVKTVGMERKDLERIAAEVASRRPPPPPAAAPTVGYQQDNQRLQRERAEAQALHQQNIAREKMLREQQERQELLRRQQEHQQKIAKEQAEAEERRRQINLKRAEEDRIRQQQKVAEQKAAEDKRRQAVLNAQRMVEQQAAEQRRRNAEKVEAEARRREAEKQAQARQNYQHSQAHNHQYNSQQTNQQNFSGANQSHQPQYAAQHQHNSSQAPPPPTAQPSGATSPTNQKYSNAMKTLATDGAGPNASNEEKITFIKRSILGKWALNPPAMTVLRPIDQLLSSIQTAFPPAHGVAPHAHFSKWKPVPLNEFRSTGAMGAGIDEDKVKKVVKKLRFFLHPDKLPRDLNPEQEFICKMLWDIINDANEEYLSRKDQFDWMN